MRTKLTLLTLLGLAALASAGTAFIPNHKALPNRREVRKGHFGTTEIVEYPDEDSVDKMLKTVYLPNKHFTRDYERQTRALQQAQVQYKVNRERMSENKIYTCDNRGNVNPFNPDDAGFFIPVSVGSLNNQQQTITYTQGTCFKNITFSYMQTATGFDGASGDVTVTIDVENSDSLFCKDWFFFATSDIQHVETFYLSGKHTITFKDLNADALAEIFDSGLRVYMFCDGYSDTIISVYNSLLCFLGGLGTDPNDPIWGSHVPDYMENANK